MNQKTVIVIISEIIKHLAGKHDQSNHGIRSHALSPSGVEYTLRTLTSGTKIGSAADISAWAEDSVYDSVLYHYSQNVDAIYREGFNFKHDKSQGDGIYFAYDDELSKDFGQGQKPIRVKLNVNYDEYFDFSDEDTMKFIADSGVDLGSEPGKLGPALRELGFKVWNDGTQVGVLDPSVIGIISNDS